MTTSDLTITLSVDQTPTQVFNAINNVQLWWSEDFNGQSQSVNDEFEVRFGTMHYSKQKVVEIIPAKKVVWLVTVSHLSFLKNKTEWTNTKMIFELSESDNKTLLSFTHQGLTSESECYNDCLNGWGKFLQNSLVPLIESGKGNPNVLNKEVQEKADREDKN